MTNKLMPGEKVPELKVNILNGEDWKLSEDAFTNMKLIVFYRGLHCPLCKAYVGELDKKINEFAQLDIDIVAISGDSEEKAKLTKAKWNLQEIKIGYNHSVESMAKWGLYISEGAFPSEPSLFNEPGIFLIKSDKTLFFAGVNNAPFARPPLDDLISGIKYITTNDYPVRGTVEMSKYNMVEELITNT
ncbi:redoxin domain-containing protein [Rivularia sp. PCC 7116]|uniref:redoxin domain-containing protein n=1 Tax=Rivularia sp. PCC 7116 TaxID=373994 RepID=UPI0005C7CAF0|nr:redoxin domain-containing protein [Rivularia sp. PCC 7116]